MTPEKLDYDVLEKLVAGGFLRIFSILFVRSLKCVVQVALEDFCFNVHCTFAGERANEISENVEISMDLTYRRIEISFICHIIV